MVKSPKHTDGECVDADSEEDPSVFRQLFRFAIYRLLPNCLKVVCAHRGSCSWRVLFACSLVERTMVEVDQSWADDESF